MHVMTSTKECPDSWLRSLQQLSDFGSSCTYATVSIIKQRCTGRDAASCTRVDAMLLHGLKPPALALLDDEAV